MKIIYLNRIAQFVLKHYRIIRYIFNFQMFTFFYHRAHYITLPSFNNLILNKSICSITISGVYHAVFDRQTVRR